ncbi:MAG: hypothetical protein V1802_01500 [Candidatus Aenigmatarchaeota archaeon]
MRCPKISPFYVMILIYAAVIIGSIFYFVYMQKFGTQGLEFSVTGEDRTFSIFDMLILLLTPVAFVLFIVSALAYRRKKDTRLFLVSLAFFFFLVKEVLNLLENFFPKEFIFIGNAERALEFLILLSFVFLLYRK